MLENKFKRQAKKVEVSTIMYSLSISKLFQEERT